MTWVYFFIKIENSQVYSDPYIFKSIKYIWLNKWLSTRGDCGPMELYLAMFRVNFIATTELRGREKVFLASRGQKSRMMLNTLQCSGQSPRTKNDPTKNANSTQAEKP